MLTHRQITRKKARAWQVGAIALAGLAAGAAVLPMQKILTPGALVQGETPGDTGAQPVEPALLPPQVDTQQIARVLGAVGEKAAPPPPPPPPAPVASNGQGGTTPPPPVAPPPSPALAYVGSIITPRSRHAVVRVGEARRLVREGDEVDGARVVLVEPDQLTLERGGREDVVRLQERTMAWPDNPPKRPVAFRTPSAPAGAGGAGGAGKGGMPMPPSMPVPATFDQAREQARARALAEAARRAAVPPPVPQPVQPLISPKSDQNVPMAPGDASMYLNRSELDVSPDAMRALESLGVYAGMSQDEAIETLRRNGVENEERVSKLLEFNLQRLPAGVEPDQADLYQQLTPIERTVIARMPPEARSAFMNKRAQGVDPTDPQFAPEVPQK
jgi:hypothetical protein